MAVNDTEHTDDYSDRETRKDPLKIIGLVLVGKFYIDEHLNSGGFGELYKGHNVALEEQKVVIKFLKKSHETDRFVKEAKMLSILDHPNICRIIDFVVDERALIVPFIDGRNCDEIIADSGPLPEQMILKVARVVLDVLMFVHEQKIAHRDIKPSNIMIDKNGHIYLIDFGIAKQIGDTLTKTGYQALTPQFAAPERLRGDKEYNPFLSDIYELGATLCRLATNLTPAEVADDWKSLNLSSEMRRILRKATERFPGDRYQSVAEFSHALNKVKRVYRRPRSLMFAYAGAACVVIAGAWLIGRPYLTDVISPPTPQTSSSTHSDPSGDTSTPATVAQPIVKSPSEVPRVEAKTESREDSVAKHSTASPRVIDSQVSNTNPLPSLSISVKPQFNTRLYVDGQEQSLDRELTVKQGEHEIKIVNPYYPIVKNSITVNADMPLRYPLDSMFADAKRHNLVIGLDSRLQDGKLAIFINGSERQVKYTAADYFPYVTVVAGVWDIRFEVTDASGKPMTIDSSKTFPYDASRPQKKYSGDRAEIDLRGPEFNDVEDIDITLF